MANSKEKIFQIYKDFLGRIAKIEELVTIGSRLLTGFQQGLDSVRRPPFDKTSKLIARIIKENKTKWLSNYIDAGCQNVHNSVQSISKLHTYHLGLTDHLNKVKDIMDELEVFLHNAEAEVGAAIDNLHHSRHKDLEPDLMALSVEEESLSGCQKPDATDYGVTMAIIYSMVKQDYNMQERIVSSLSPKTSSGELESYCLMWSLRPFIDDEVMHEAWKLIP